MQNPKHPKPLLIFINNFLLVPMGLYAVLTTAIPIYHPGKLSEPFFSLFILGVFLSPAVLLLSLKLALKGDRSPSVWIACLLGAFSTVVWAYELWRKVTS